MQATITFYLTEAAQRAQMAATGQPVARKQVHRVEIAADELPYVDVFDDGSATKTLHAFANWSPLLTTSDGAEAWRIYIAARREQERKDGVVNAQNRAKLDATVTAYLAGEDCGAYSQIDDAVGFPGCPYYVDKDHPRYPEVHGEFLRRKQAIADATRAKEIAEGEEAYRQLLADPGARMAYTQSSDSTGAGPATFQGGKIRGLCENHPRKAEWDTELRRRAEADKSAAVEKEREKTAAIDAFVAQSGNELMIRQHADGLLCRKTALSELAKSVLDAAIGRREQEDSVVCEDRECPCRDEAIDCIPPAIYADWKSLPEFPSGSKVDFRKVRNCLDLRNCWDGETAGPIEYHAIITIPSGPFQFVRRIKLEAK